MRILFDQSYESYLTNYEYSWVISAGSGFLRKSTGANGMKWASKIDHIIGMYIYTIFYNSLYIYGKLTI